MYRIITEKKSVAAIKALLGKLGLDFTVYYADGSWRGNAESSLLIELDLASEDSAVRAARLIKKSNAQHAILLQEIPTKSRLM
jgi:hypothetical protein